MIQLFTDFTRAGPYVGQLHGVLNSLLPDEAVVDLMHDAPAFNPRAASYLLASLLQGLSAEDICVAVVDPGVGSSRRPLAIRADRRWFIGPDNGLFSVLPHHARHIEYFEIIWQPDTLSHSFHGRDLFAPMAAAIALNQTEGKLAAIEPIACSPPTLDEIIYIDGFGNAMTGLQGEQISPSENLIVGRQAFRPAATFSDQPIGTPLWYVNSNGLIELSICQGHAADTLELCIGDKIIQDL